VHTGGILKRAERLLGGVEVALKRLPRRFNALFRQGLHFRWDLEAAGFHGGAPLPLFTT